MEFSTEIKGQKELEKYLKKISEPNKYFDEDFKAETLQASRRLKEDTPKRTGFTAGAWSSFKKVGNSNYISFNATKSSDGKHLIVDILNYGRGAVRPKRSKKLFIPLSEKAKGGGKGLVFGEDFIYADYAKPFKGTKFVEKEVETATEQLIKRMLRRIESGK